MLRRSFTAHSRGQGLPLAGINRSLHFACESSHGPQRCAPARNTRVTEVTQPGYRIQPLSSRSFSSSSTRCAIIPFKLHDIGEGITEVEMLKWKVEEGQRVEHFDDLCEVQSDKSTAELTSPTPGIVHSIKVQEGDTVKVGQTLCEIRTEDGAEVDEQPSSDMSQEPPVEQEKNITDNEEVTRAEQVSEEVEKHAEGTPDAETVTSLKPSAPEQTEVDLSDSQEDTSTGVRFTGEASILPSAPAPSRTNVLDQAVLERREREKDVSKKVVLSSPAVRTLAARLGVDLVDIEGSGEKGRITREDVESFAQAAPLPSSSSSGGSHTRTKKERAESTETTRVEFGRTRKVMWKALGAQGEVPHFGYSHTLDLTPLLPYLRAANPEQAQIKQSYLASDIPSSLIGDPMPPTAAQKTTLLSFLVKAMLLAMEEHPIMRAKVIKKDDERYLEIRRDGIIGVAVSDPKYGLVTPSLPPLPPWTTLSSLTTHLSHVRAHPTKPGPSANVVISSVGGLGESTGAMPIIPPGGPVAICAVGRAKWEMEWKLRDAGMKTTQEEVEKGGVRAVLRCPVGWSGDHRVLEGAELIAFTESWKRWIEEPWRWIRVDG